jgi:hypothetical protein
MTPARTWSRAHPGLALAAMLAWPAAAPAATPAATLSGVPPIVNVCWDYGCDRSMRLVLPEPAWDSIRALFVPAAPDPAVERARIARAIARFEAAVGTVTGTHADRHGNIVGAGQPGQLDCIDESRNTAGYLHVLADRGLLRWHRVGRRHKRIFWVIGQHWTASVIDSRDGTPWAIDSWFLDNGHQPHVQRLDAWLAQAPLPPNPDAS